MTLRNMSSRFVILSLALATLAGTAHAQDTAAPETISSDPAPFMDGWTLQFEPLVHYIAPAGDVRLPGSTGIDTDEVSVDDLNLDDPRAVPFGEIHFRRGKWRISASGFWYSLDDREATADESFQLGDLSVAAGDRLESSIDFWTLEAVASYRVFTDQTDLNSRGKVGAAVGVDILGGIRFYDVDFDVSSAGATTGADNLWAQPVLGARMEVAIWESFGFDVTSAFGYLPAGDTTSFSWDIIAAFHWRPWENVGVQIGYQQLAVTLEDGDDDEEFRWQGGMAGIFGGLILRF